MNKLNILIKLLLVGLIASLIASLYSCNNNSVTITKEEYNKLKGDTIKPEYPKEFEINGHKTTIYLASNGHDYAYYGYYLNYEHYIECKKCKKDSVYLTK